MEHALDHTAKSESSQNSNPGSVAALRQHIGLQPESCWGICQALSGLWFLRREACV